MDMVGGCCVCLDERGWDENPLVYCDGHGCNVAVHQACYGIVKVPKGPWFCCKCQSTERTARVKCDLCPFKEGALKRTDTGGWAHVVCALYIPEVRFGNVSTMEPILISSVQHERFLKTCYICEENGRESKTSSGACMTCNKPGCKQNFHVTCAQSKRMLCEEAGNFGNVQYVGYCAQHWSKKSGQKGNAHIDSETRKMKEKKHRNRQDSISSGDGAATKPKQKKQTGLPKSSSNNDSSISCTSSQSFPIMQNQSNSNENFLNFDLNFSKAGTAEQSAVESLNLLQQTPSMLDYFPPNVNVKTPLNTIISPQDKFSVANLISKKPNVNKPVEPIDEIIDIESNRISPVNLISHEISQKPSEKSKSSISSAEKSQNVSAKNPVATKKSSLSIGKTSSSGSKNDKPEGKKRKYSGIHNDKNSNKAKPEERKKLQIKKGEKGEKNHSYLPKPSKLGLFEDGEIPSLYPSGRGETGIDSFKDLLESQWDQGAQFLMQQATHFNVGTLLSCFHQLRSENESLENRLSQLSARRDRLIAATSRLSKPFDVSLELNRPQPISSMLAKLNSKPQGDKRPSKEKKNNASKGRKTDTNPQQNVSKIASTPKSKVESGLNGSENNDINANVECHSDSSLDELSCKEVFCETNSLNSSPIDHNKDKTVIKDKKKKRIKSPGSEETSRQFLDNNEESEKHVHLQNSLVQPLLCNPSAPNHIVNDTANLQNPVEFIHRIVRQESSNLTSPAHRDPSDILRFFANQTGVINSRMNNITNGYATQTPENHATPSCNPAAQL